MPDTPTTGHGLGRFLDCENPGAAALNLNWTKVDTRLVGTGTSFPSTYPVTGLFLREDEKRVYKNIGTEAVPVWVIVIESEMGMALPVLEFLGVSLADDLPFFRNFVTLPSYTPGFDTLLVYRNGQKLVRGIGPTDKDWFEYDSTHVRINRTLALDDVISVVPR